ncbi:hypothetical protein Q7C36_000059 [Tachysurus vachellii]|uniref:Uncharacterized protein n=1 Tax=Tachysurus vachellii TaxID=175792 RepID=A0AA88T8Q0_TACVA|nr:hypothetical protein Q7C36_000059 [Tachysurus vachellii]
MKHGSEVHRVLFTGLQRPAETRRVHWHGQGGKKFTHKALIIQGFGRGAFARSLGHCAQYSTDEVQEVPLITTQRCGKVIKV